MEREYAPYLFIRVRSPKVIFRSVVRQYSCEKCSRTYLPLDNDIG
jgi:hypothetical protein